jgi:hypothetical protein
MEMRSKVDYMNRPAMHFAVFIVLMFFGTRLHPQSLEIKLVDGRNGLPVASSCVGVFVGRDSKVELGIPTDKDGVARLRLTHHESEIDLHHQAVGCGEDGVIDPVVKYEPVVGINTGYALCDTRKRDFLELAISSFSTKRLIQSGIVTPNTCRKARASAVPGQIVIFVRPMMWWEKAVE